MPVRVRCSGPILALKDEGCVSADEIQELFHIRRNGRVGVLLAELEVVLPDFLTDGSEKLLQWNEQLNQAAAHVAAGGCYYDVVPSEIRVRHGILRNVGRSDDGLCAGEVLFVNTV